MTQVALIFPGQGSQYIGMGKEFYESSPEAKAIFQKADHIIPGLTDVIFNGPEEKLISTKYCQPAIFTTSIAALTALKRSEKFSALQPVFACGHSLGEYSAVMAAGALSFEEALKLVERRSFFMEEATKLKKGAMAAVIGMPQEKLFQLCMECEVEMANFNAPDQIVITGAYDSMQDAIKLIQEEGAKRVIPLAVSGAFHSSLMKPAAQNFEKELAKVHFKVPSFPVISNVDALPEINPEFIKHNLAKQITSSVKWVDTIQYIAAHNVTTFFEIGPGTVLKGLIRKINKDLIVHNIQIVEDLQKLPV